MSELVPVDALLDITDDRAWLRADGYHRSPGDVPLSPGEVRRLHLRRGDHVTGFADRSKNTAQFQLTAVNGRPPGPRPDFYRRTALHPHDRLRLETDPNVLTTRVIDLFMPIGKGQRAIIAAPPKAGKTTILQDIATAVTRNHPECHLMVLLVDERPEEVTDMRRTVKGEVIASTFDRPPAEHTAVAELATERAKRLAEQGEDVVLLLDSLTRLGRAYNMTAPPRGRTLTGGLDTSALHPPKHLLGAARTLEGGGSVTVIATALVENGSAMDTLIFEELKSTGNAELKLDRALAEARLFPAVDVAASGTRHDEALLHPGELPLITHLRRAMSTPDRRGPMTHLLKQLRATPGNAAYLNKIKSSVSYAQ
ncbi:transcription termination factor Rho [Actinoplanes sp. NEAU-A12]|uniref:Transcription termination factor Rho n=1 Tax=Actinoplanes sandaracinus TaxID=3045177 RepID=A0ABT6WMH8_9ACTN|nr:transcription termination factor Rho [Actinoplanes sandaracinus]MDI6100933.1 transcription termination factor Rho [Actinoplanes sandaracinus]